MRHEKIARLLWERATPLFLILDTTHSGVIGRRDETAAAGPLQRASLYEGADAVTLREVEPVLLALGANRAAHDQLLAAGWGKSWGIYLTSASPLAEVAAHLRGLIKVRIEDGETMYFRFYDPRVLRVFLPTCAPAERLQFFGPIQSFWMESEDPSECMAFHRTGESQRMA